MRVKVTAGTEFEAGLMETSGKGKVLNGIFLRAVDSNANIFVVAVSEGKELYAFSPVQLLKDLGWTPPVEE